MTSPNRSAGENASSFTFVANLPPPTPTATPTHPSSGQAQVINGLAAASTPPPPPAGLSSLSLSSAVEALHSSVVVGDQSGSQTSNRIGASVSASSGASISANCVASVVSAMLSISAQQQPQKQPHQVVVANTKTLAATTTLTTTSTTGDTNCDDKMKSDRTLSAAPSESEMMIKRVVDRSGGNGNRLPPRISVASTTSVQTKAATSAVSADGGQLVAASGAVVSVANDVESAALSVPLRGSRSDKASVDGVEQLIRRLQMAEEEVFDDEVDDDPYAELEYYLENVKVSARGMIF